jgi:15-cis-phytoene synthase
VHQVDRAKSFYARADAKLPKHDAARLVAARIMGAIYRDLLRTIERNGYDVFRMQPRVARPRQAAIAAVTWLRSLVQW